MFKMTINRVRRQRRNETVLNSAQYYVPTTLDSFLIADHKAPFDTQNSVRVTSDIYMLFNQQRLDRMTREAVINHFNEMVVKDSSLQNLRDKMTDDQLMSVVKSRYMQAPSELLAWSRWLNAQADTYIKDYLAAQQETSKKPGVTVVDDQQSTTTPQ